MGVKDFLKVKIVNSKSEYNEKMIIELGEEVKLANLKGQRICIDAMNMIYRAILAMQTVTALSDADGKTTAHINTIFNQIIMFKKAGIVQIWIFDNPECCKLKKENALADRAVKRSESNKEKVQFKVTGEHIKDIQSLLEGMGVMYITAPPGIEAEQYGAMMTRGDKDERFCQYMFSNDSDVLLFGGNLLKPLSKATATGKSKKTVYIKFEISEVLEEIDLTQNQLIEVGLALGCDFAPKTLRVGPKTVVKKVRDRNIKFTPEQIEAGAYFAQEVKKTKPDVVQSEYSRIKVTEQLIARKFQADRLNKRLDEYESLSF